VSLRSPHPNPRSLYRPDEPHRGWRLHRWGSDQSSLPGCEGQSLSSQRTFLRKGMLVKNQKRKVRVTFLMAYWSRPGVASPKDDSLLASSTSTAPAPGRNLGSLTIPLKTFTPSSLSICKLDQLITTKERKKVSYQ